MSAVTKLEELARELSEGLVRLGIRVPGGNLRGVPTDTLKFLLKQQQKALQDNTDPTKTGSTRVRLAGFIRIVVL